MDDQKFYADWYLGVALAAVLMVSCATIAVVYISLRLRYKFFKGMKRLDVCVEAGVKVNSVLITIPASPH